MQVTNLPVQLTSFIGRELELAELDRLLSRSRLITLTGAGGCGKSRLALQLANGLHDVFDEGIWFVELVSLNDPSLLRQLISQSLKIARSPDQPALESLLNHVQSKKLLLILDSCEHLIGDCASLANRWRISGSSTQR
jgi:predicted ATPase